MFVFLILRLLIEKSSITLSTRINKYRIIMDTNISLTEINTPNGTYQTEITVSNDETNNVSCFNRVVKTITPSKANIKRYATAIITGGILGLVAYAVTLENKLGVYDIVEDPYNMTATDRQIEDKLSHNNHVSFYSSIFSHAIIGVVVIILDKWFFARTENPD
jgi:hypothetical protein